MAIANTTITLTRRKARKAGSDGKFATGTQCVTLPYPPPVNNATTVFRGRKIKSSRGRAYVADAQGMILRSGILPVQGDVTVQLKFYRPRKRGDLDNLFKAPLDALTGFAYADDDQVREIWAMRFDDKVNPRVEVAIIPFVAAETGGTP